MNCELDGLYTIQARTAQVDKVFRYLKINPSKNSMETMTETKLKTAAEMFVYLNSCSDLFKPWLVFYTELFQNKSPRHIILTLNRILKVDTTQENQNFRIIAMKLMKRASTLLSLKYKKVQNIISGQSDGRTENVLTGSLVVIIYNLISWILVDQ